MHSFSFVPEVHVKDGADDLQQQRHPRELCATGWHAEFTRLSKSNKPHLFGAQLFHEAVCVCVFMGGVVGLTPGSRASGLDCPYFPRHIFPMRCSTLFWLRKCLVLPCIAISSAVCS
eukprot:7380871-Prymnesium_polylepis.5